ncbi:hypothetical protein [Chitinophaga sp. LS1]|uniref:hypothetical protein n=1 Tax=Chitinophaga sp. LS1 TaxID=3051176 RepID=UPI002AABE95C|nr:hypothetical protein [Chitinophaga sp. LS1]WPV67050.1 hypothetical protein QQL36_35245 [Chitinophaga sp. LS1]
MKNIKLIGLLFLLSCNQSPKECINPYTIDLWNINGSLAYNRSYHIHEDTLRISFNDKLENGKDSVLYEKVLDKNQLNEFCNYISSFNIDTLKSEYINHSITDGDQKILDITIGVKRKSVYISNVYITNIADLINHINELIDSSKLKIKYANYNFKPPEVY